MPSPMHVTLVEWYTCYIHLFNHSRPLESTRGGCLGDVHCVCIIITTHVCITQWVWSLLIIHGVPKLAGCVVRVCVHVELDLV